MDDEDGGSMQLHFARPTTERKRPAADDGVVGDKKRVRTGERTRPAAKAPPEQPVMNKPFVSSLFTHNPDVETQRAAAAAAAASPALSRPKAATNAAVSSAKFDALGLDSRWSGVLAAKQITAPTEIQVKAIPLLLSGSDAFIHAETGSGKTLSFLLPIVQRLSTLPERISRSDGTLAIVLAPTRELAQQTYAVLEWLCRAAVWIVPGFVTGGEKRQSEKARLRKGVSILVATPGRLKDHLTHTESFAHSSCRFLVLDEADRLTDMGFEKDVLEIARLLDESARKHKNHVIGLPTKRQTIMCSATQSDDVQRVAKAVLSAPVVVSMARNAAQTKASRDRADGDGDDTPQAKERLVAPQQLRQQYTAVPPKLRLVTLIAVLRAKAATSKGVVFLSTCDSVDFHHALLTWTRPLAPGDAAADRFDPSSMTSSSSSASASSSLPSKRRKTEAEVVEEVLRGLQSTVMTKDDVMDNEGAAEEDEYEGDRRAGRGKRQRQEWKPHIVQPNHKLEPFAASTVIPGFTLYRLHGEMAQADRTKAFDAFSAAKGAAILLCTDVAARGLDLPDISYIVQYDAPTDTKDYVHRIGRTARLGRTGEALLFLMPHETAYADRLAERGLETKPIDYVTLLRRLATHAGRMSHEFEAQKIHNDLEQQTQADQQLFLLGARAFHSFVRSYATHSREDKPIFNTQALHLGHLAKSFALREPPSKVSVRLRKQKTKSAKAAPALASAGGSGGQAASLVRREREEEHRRSRLSEGFGLIEEEKLRKKQAAAVSEFGGEVVSGAMAGKRR